MDYVLENYYVGAFNRMAYQAVLAALDEFECKLCGRKLHAGVNASRNLLNRVRWDWHLHRMEKALVKQVEEFIRSLFDERYRCLWSKTLGAGKRANTFSQSLNLRCG